VEKHGSSPRSAWIALISSVCDVCMADSFSPKLHASCCSSFNVIIIFSGKIFCGGYVMRLRNAHADKDE
jgi:hypothetical protein